MGWDVGTRRATSSRDDRITEIGSDLNGGKEEENGSVIRHKQGGPFF